MSDEDGDPDREAILKRRTRLLGLALSGALLAAGCDAAPVPCLEPALPDAGPRDAGE